MWDRILKLWRTPDIRSGVACEIQQSWHDFQSLATLEDIWNASAIEAELPESCQVEEDGADTPKAH